MDPNQKGIPIDDDEFTIELLPEDFAQYDISFKIIVIGDSSVGKSCLTTQAVRNNFVEFYQATVGFEFLTFNLRINSNVIKLQIWDTCGQEVYKSLISNFYRNCSLALIVYAINNRNSFEHAENWLNDLKNQSNPNVRVFLIGNKSDLEKDRTVSKEEGEQFKQEKKLDRFMETSAKTGDNARNVMLQAAKILYKDYLKAKESFPIYSLGEILSQNENLSAEIVSKIKPFMYFEDYLKTGYYPFFLEGEDDYYNRLNETINMILDVELPILRGMEISCIPKIKKLLSVIGRSAPFIPNVTELASKVGIARQTLLSYFKYLDESKLIGELFKETRGLGALEKPDKILLENTNLMYLFDDEKTDIGNIRKTFVFNQLKKAHKIQFSVESDFLVDGKYTFEVGGKNKKRAQIKEIENSYIIADNIEYGTDRRIPIWLLGFLY